LTGIYKISLTVPKQKFKINLLILKPTKKSTGIDPMGKIKIA